jgi:TetR/AcrR family transcriptional regulator, tetracycline repressor protein
MVIDATIELIDASGLDEFSLRKLARHLHVFPAALQWHSGKRDELLASVVERVLRDRDQAGDDLPWDQWIFWNAQAYRKLVHEHPNLAPLMTTFLVSNVTTDYSRVERLLGKLVEAGFAGIALLDAFNVAMFTTFGFVGVELGPAPGEDHDEWAAEVRTSVESLPAEEFRVIGHNRELLADNAVVFRWSSGTVRPMDHAFEAVMGAAISGMRESLRLGRPLRELSPSFVV